MYQFQSWPVVQVEAQRAHCRLRADVCPARPRQTVEPLQRFHFRVLDAGWPVASGRQGLQRLHRCRTGEDIKPGLNVTNYERIHHFDPKKFKSIVLDEASICSWNLDLLFFSNSISLFFEVLLSYTFHYMYHLLMCFLKYF